MFDLPGVEHLKLVIVCKRIEKDPRETKLYREPFHPFYFLKYDAFSSLKIVDKVDI